MLVMDAKFSLKRMATVASRSAGDTQKFNDSGFYLDTAFIDQYAPEVQKHPGTEQPSVAIDPNQSDDEHEKKGNNSEEGDPTDGAPSVVISQCTDNWKAAASEEKKRMWGVFEETGIFACACRHGQIMWLADMIRSGEL